MKNRFCKPKLADYSDEEGENERSPTVRGTLWLDAQEFLDADNYNFEKLHKLGFLMYIE